MGSRHVVSMTSGCQHWRMRRRVIGHFINAVPITNSIRTDYDITTISRLKKMAIAENRDDVAKTR
jgi:hypothetical protein